MKAALILGIIAAGLLAQAGEKPNVVFLLSDDQGWADYGFMGHPHIKTPQLVEHLKEKGLYDNTLFVYTCDNGWVPNPDRVGKFTRSKREPVEAGIRTPIFLTHKNGIKPRRDAETLASNIDIAPTILRACGIEPDAAMSGLDLRDPKALARRGRIFVDVYEHDMDIDAVGDIDSNLTARVVIDGWDKLIARPSGKELYDLKNDPDDRRDISTQQPKKVEKLLTLIDAWLEATPFARDGF